MWILYDLAIHLYGTALRTAALFNPKARLWVRGRKEQWERLQAAVRRSPFAVTSPPSPQLQFGKGESGGEIIWFHCASLGEFEQGRPVIEGFRKKHPDWKILLTFFSPSGYEVRKDYQGADWVYYLPMDTPFNARKFIRIVRPGMAVFIKYEFWFRYLDRLHRENIPVFFISGIFRPGQHFFRWYGGWARKQLRKISHFFVQDSPSKDLLMGIGIERVTVSGDTRFDRVSAIAATAKEYPLVKAFAGGLPVILAGSTWPADEALMSGLITEMHGKARFIIAPHEIKTNSTFNIQHSTLTQVRFSELNEQSAARADVLIVDGIGYLSRLYRYCTIAYIGGGFGVGIHNILEAATFGKPVIFGPNYGRFREAVELVALGGAFPVNDAQEFREIVKKLFEDKEFYHSASNVCSSYVRKNCGATKIILKGLC